MIFSEWIKNEFGYGSRIKASDYLGVPYKTVISWANLSRFPQLREQELIKIKSNGKVDFDAWRTKYLDQQNKQKKNKKECSAC